ncbi:hypothetical protein [Pediococcus damnosus]|uniref:hypothetical protein n=1 Tax=Pediococcus damnosus TaxID=51663 RepID=UPI001EE0488B|nr:hypothetical protein [Pediococcus damnosus]
MAKTLDFTDMSPRTVKIGDTTTSFTLICGNNNMATDLTNATSITVKLGNSSGYLKSATVDPASLTDSTPDQVTVTFTADLMTSLSAGSYTIEVWVVDSTGTSIYPSDGSTGFTIDNNIQSANGSVITTITFDDFVNKFNTIAANALPGTTDTTNFQKLKITDDNGVQLNSITNSNGLDLNKVLLATNGFQTFYVQQGSTNNPSNDSMRGFAQVHGMFGLGIFVPTNSTGGGMWIATVCTNSVIWQNVTTDDKTKIIWNA